MGRFIVGDQNGRQLGSVLFRPCEIILLEINRLHRGRGLGSGLLRQAEQALMLEGCHQISLFAARLDSMDPHPYEFYRKMGYEESRLSHRMVKRLQPHDADAFAYAFAYISA